jgi:hypothetical protein
VKSLRVALRIIFIHGPTVDLLDARATNRTSSFLVLPLISNCSPHRSIARMCHARKIAALSVARNDTLIYMTRRQLFTVPENSRRRSAKQPQKSHARYLHQRLIGNDADAEISLQLRSRRRLASYRLVAEVQSRRDAVKQVFRGYQFGGNA